MNYKEISKAFLDMCITDQVEKAYALYVHNDLIHHHQGIKKDRQSLLDAMIADNKIHKDKKITLLMQIEEDQYVSTYSIVEVNKDTKYRVVHMFRFLDDLIIEAWDIGEEVIKDSLN